jgi:transposase
MSASYCVGIDVALHAHRVGVLGPEGEAVGPSLAIATTQEGFADLVRTLQARGAVPAATLVGLEATGHYWENLEAALVQAGYRVLLLNALQTRRYRDVLRRKAKTDDIDAYVVAGLLRSGSAEGCFVPDDQIQSLRELARLRARLMRERQDYLRQLVGQLDVVFPEHRTALGDVSTVRARGLLAAFPTAHHLAQATPAALRRRAHRAHARGFSLADATTLRDQARSSAYSGKAAPARGQVVRTLLAQYERLTTAITELDEAVHALLPPTEASGGPSDATLLQTLPGVGPHTAGTLLGEVGSFTRFANARALVAYVGFYPVINQSGERTALPYLSPVGSRIARHVLYLAAVNAVRRSAEWRALYRRKTAQGKTAKQALIAVAVKWLHTAYAMLKHRAPYDPTRLAGMPATLST